MVLLVNKMLMRNLAKRSFRRKLVHCTNGSVLTSCSYGTKVIRDILKLYEKGVFSKLCPDMSEPNVSQLLSTPQSVYCGFDPTANSLHVGNLLAIIGLIHCQRAGHTPIAVVGGATAQIGDPSGKMSDRPKMDAEIIENNILGITENLERIFLNHEMYLWKGASPLKPAKILNNIEWYEDRNVLEFLSDVGRHFRMGPMLGKHSVKSRLESPKGMCFTEFTYQIFQAYDWLHLYKTYGCMLQIGGTDQIGNIYSGIELLHKVERKDVYGLTIPLLTTSAGEKFGKTEKHAVWLDANKTTPYELYQFFVNISDDEVEKYLNLFTFLPDKDIGDVIRNQRLHPEKRTSQILLAEKVVTLIHGEEGVSEAKRWTRAFFSNDPQVLANLTEHELLKIFCSTPTIEMLYDSSKTVFDLAKNIKSKSFPFEDRITQIIQEGGFYINHQRVTEPGFVLVPGQHILPNDLTLVRIGKKNYHVVKWIYQ